MDSIIAEAPAVPVMDRTDELDARRQELERELERSPVPDVVVFHPTMVDA